MFFHYAQTQTNFESCSSLPCPKQDSARSFATDICSSKGTFIPSLSSNATVVRSGTATYWMGLRIDIWTTATSPHLYNTLTWKTVSFDFLQLQKWLWVILWLQEIGSLLCDSMWWLRWKWLQQFWKNSHFLLRRWWRASLWCTREQRQSRFRFITPHKWNSWFPDDWRE